MYYLTDEGTLYDTLINPSIPNLREMKNVRCSDNIFKLLNVYDFVYTLSDKGEDVGFVCEVTKEYFVVTFTHRGNKVQFKFENDKKLRLIKELWTRTNIKTFRKFWENKDLK